MSTLSNSKPIFIFDAVEWHASRARVDAGSNWYHDVVASGSSAGSSQLQTAMGHVYS